MAVCSLQGPPRNHEARCAGLREVGRPDGDRTEPLVPGANLVAYVYHVTLKEYGGVHAPSESHNPRQRKLRPGRIQDVAVARCANPDSDGGCAPHDCGSDVVFAKGLRDHLPIIGEFS